MIKTNYTMTAVQPIFTGSDEEVEKTMNLERAIKTIEKVHGFDDNSTGVGEAWDYIKELLRVSPDMGRGKIYNEISEERKQ